MLSVQLISDGLFAIIDLLLTTCQDSFISFQLHLLYTHSVVMDIHPSLAHQFQWIVVGRTIWIRTTCAGRWFNRCSSMGLHFHLSLLWHIGDVGDAVPLLANFVVTWNTRVQWMRYTVLSRDVFSGVIHDFIVTHNGRHGNRSILTIGKKSKINWQWITWKPSKVYDEFMSIVILTQLTINSFSDSICSNHEFGVFTGSRGVLFTTAAYESVFAFDWSICHGKLHEKYFILLWNCKNTDEKIPNSVTRKKIICVWHNHTFCFVYAILRLLINITLFFTENSYDSTKTNQLKWNFVVFYRNSLYSVELFNATSPLPKMFAAQLVRVDCVNVTTVWSQTEPANCICSEQTLWRVHKCHFVSLYACELNTNGKFNLLTHNWHECLCFYMYFHVLLLFNNKFTLWFI